VHVVEQGLMRRQERDEGRRGKAGKGALQNSVVFCVACIV